MLRPAYFHPDHPRPTRVAATKSREVEGQAAAKEEAASKSPSCTTIKTKGLIREAEKA